ncbi:MAG: ATP-binding protein [Colwellia sp.]
MRYENLQPSPSSLMESLRDIGYSMETALADVIDNSITAKASEINLSFSWNVEESWLAIEDDGIGMSYDELLYAMRLGSENPLNDRSADDLGRFGLGLKTASFSQCRQLTVLTKKNDIISAMEWDLDEITMNPTDGWRIKVLSDNDILEIPEIHSIYDKFIHNDSGTIVLWRKLDRLDNFDSLATREKKLNLLIDSSRKHIELTFHRFLKAGKGKKSLRILLNGDSLEGFDPFNPDHNATIELPVQSIYVDNQQISVQPYVLPHYTKVSLDTYEKYAGDGGYLHNQGFYVYRNKRLIIKNSWFRLMPKEELTKLIRIKVDIPNTLDHIWKIDVKKSNASPPESVRKQFKQIISEVEYSGKRVFRQKGHKLTTKIKEPIWNRTISSGKVIYDISREHQLLKSFSNKLNKNEQLEFKSIIKSIESSFPSDLYFNDFANSPERVEKPAISTEELEAIFEVFLPTFISVQANKEKIVEEMLKIEPFASFPELTKRIIENKDIDL